MTPRMRVARRGWKWVVGIAVLGSRLARWCRAGRAHRRPTIHARCWRAVEVAAASEPEDVKVPRRARLCTRRGVPLELHAWRRVKQAVEHAQGDDGRDRELARARRTCSPPSRRRRSSFPVMRATWSRPRIVVPIRTPSHEKQPGLSGAPRRRGSTCVVGVERVRRSVVTRAVRSSPTSMAPGIAKHEDLAGRPHPHCSAARWNGSRLGDASAPLRPRRGRAARQTAFGALASPRRGPGRHVEQGRRRAAAAAVDRAQAEPRPVCRPSSSSTRSGPRGRFSSRCGSSGTTCSTRSRSHRARRRGSSRRPATQT